MTTSEISEILQKKKGIVAFLSHAMKPQGETGGNLVMERRRVPRLVGLVGPRA